MINSKDLICQYCKEEDNSITGRVIRTTEFKETYGYSLRRVGLEREYLNVFILKGKEDKHAGLMIENLTGSRYVDIRYCPFCGRKLSVEELKR